MDAAAKRAAARADWPIRIFRLGEDEEADVPLDATPSEMVAMVRVLTRRCWEVSGVPIPRHERAALPGRVIRGHGRGR